MALKIIDKKIVGEIYFLEDKLEGKIPIDRLELLYLINSWGRSETFFTYNNDIKIKIKKCEAKECYYLSKLDVSQITDMSNLFESSLFNGDISNWNTSNVTNMCQMFDRAERFNQELNFDTLKVTSMKEMFCFAEKFNQPLNFNTSNVKNMEWMFYKTNIFNQELNFDTSNVTNMRCMFYGAKEFNQPLNWDTSKVINMEYMFNNAEAFENKYNNGKPLPEDTDEIKEWFINNRERMKDLDIKDTHGKEIDDFFSNITDIYSTNRIGLHNNIHSLPISIP